jgi:hypothetical protein
MAEIAGLVLPVGVHDGNAGRQLRLGEVVV